MAGCNVVPPPQADPTRFYVLASPAPAVPGGVTKLKRLNLRPVDVAAYLRSRPIVVRRGDNEVQFRDFARWGEPLEQGVAPRRLAQQAAGLLVELAGGFVAEQPVSDREKHQHVGIGRVGAARGLDPGDELLRTAVRP